MRQYLIPANSKKSMLIFGLFKPFDLILFGIGMGTSLLLLVTLPIDQLVFSIIALAPGLICSFLVIPLPNYHNMLTIISEAYNFYTTRQCYVWKGWCFSDESKDKK